MEWELCFPLFLILLFSVSLSELYLCNTLRFTCSLTLRTCDTTLARDSVSSLQIKLVTVAIILLPASRTSPSRSLSDPTLPPSPNECLIILTILTIILLIRIRFPRWLSLASFSQRCSCVGFRSVLRRMGILIVAYFVVKVDSSECEQDTFDIYNRSMRSDSSSRDRRKENQSELTSQSSFHPTH